jgi:acyl transferase domain-containing protein
MAPAAEPNEDLRRLREAFTAMKEMRLRIESLERARTEPIAIIGIGCRFPGGASGPDATWRLLAQGVDAVSEVPKSRWDIDAYYDPEPGAPGRMNSRWGGFLKEDVGLFEPEFFGISHREAKYMDPQQRLLLEVVWEALEHAGQPAERLAGSRTGVFVGITGQEYAWLLAHKVGFEPHAGTGCANAIAANRLSYWLDLRGPSVSVDTACSSSLVAVHIAASSLRTGECDMALAGGVNLLLSPFTTLQIASARLLSSDGRCKTFDARADGFVRGEGCGVLALKRLSDAQAAGDPILALVRGSATGQDGRSAGLTAPNVAAQEDVLRRALESGKVDPAWIGLIEAHGTGTALGDPIELEALKAVHGRPRPDGSRCALGSVKTNFGHLEAAAGIAGLIKAVLSLAHGTHVPHLHFRSLNPNISLEGTPLFIPTELTPFPAMPGQGRFAAVSSFGIGGTNAHVLLQSAPEPACAPDPPDPGRSRLLPLSARTPAALRELALAVRGVLVAPEPIAPALRDLCFTAGARRSHHAERLAIVGRTREDFLAGLESAARGEPRPGVARGARLSSGERRIVFVFSGQGSQWAGMALDLLEEEPVFREALARCEAALAAAGAAPVIESLRAAPERARLAETAIAQPAVFAIQVALAALLRSWGIAPTAVVGHSLGEVAAAHVAGALSLEDAARVVHHRGRLMQRAAGQGKGVSAALSAEACRSILRELSGLDVAAINSRTSTVLSGDVRSVEALCARLSAEGIASRLLPGDYAFHSRQMEPFQAELVASLQGITPRRASLHFHSTTTGQPCAGDELTPDYWALNLRETVQLAPAIEALAGAGNRVFLEIGPHPVLVRSVRECLDPVAAEVSIHATLRRGQPGRPCLLEALGQLYCAGAPVDWAALEPGRAAVVPLPSYPWQRRHFWIEGAPAHGQDAPRAEPAPEEVAEPGMSVEGFIHRLFAAVLGVPAEELDPDADLGARGLDSILLMDGLSRVEKRFGRTVPLSTLSRTSLTLRALARLYAGDSPAPADGAALEPPAHGSPAEPGAASDLAAFLGQAIRPAHPVDLQRVPLPSGDWVEVLSAGSGPPVVLLSPLDTVASVWKHQIERLAAGHRVIVPHSPGYGQSPFRHDAASIEALAAALPALVERLRIRGRFHLVGWSIGGMIAQTVALSSPHLLASLTLVNTTSGLNQQSSFATTSQLLRSMEEDFRRNFPERFAERSAEYRRLLVAGTEGVHARVRLHYADQALRFDASARLAAIRVPTWIVSGEEDLLTLPSHGQRIHEQIPGSLHQTLRSAGHFIPLLEAEAFNRGLLEFLTAHPAR